MQKPSKFPGTNRMYHLGLSLTVFSGEKPGIDWTRYTRNLDVRDILSRMPPAKLIEKIRKACDDESQRLDASSFWTSGIAYGKIPIFRSTYKTYNLQPTRYALQHIRLGDGLCDRFLTIRTRNNDNAQVLSLRSPQRRKGNRSVACVFVTLGYLAEVGDKTVEGASTHATKMMTYYVVLLNLSTQPASLWLIYDYHIKIFEEDIVHWTNKLGDYQDGLVAHDDERGQLVQDDFSCNNADGNQDSCDRNGNFRAHYVNMEKTCLPKPRKERTRLTGKASTKKPSIVGPSHAKSRGTDISSGPGNNAGVLSNSRLQYDVRAPSNNASDTASDKSKPVQSSASGPSKSSSPRRATGSNASHDSDAKRNVPKHSKPYDYKPKDSKGYLGLPPFDLALLAPDINEWSEDGIDLELIKKCLRSSHVHIGSSLRVQEATDKQLEVIQDKENRIDLRELGW